MQHAFKAARVGRRHQLRPRKISPHEFVGHGQPTALVTVEQMMTAGQPEIILSVHRTGPPIARSNHDEVANADTKFRRSGLDSSRWLTRRSPLSSISRLTSLSGARRVR